MEYTSSAGRFLREYRMIRELGSGGEGRVFLVQHVTTEQLRAAKQLPRKSGLDQVHELNMLKKLHHPSLPEVIDVLEEDDCVWLILSYIRGISLQEFLESRTEGESFSEADFISIAGQLAEVLRYLHQRKSPILHLDIKPSNLIWRKDGRLVLIDFGAALRGHPGVRPESCCGTPGFAAPEQYQKGHFLDARTDQYGFGAVLYYLLHGSVYQPDSREEGRRGKEKGEQRKKGAERCGQSGMKRDGRCRGRRRCRGHRRHRRHRRRWMRDADELLGNCLASKPENRYADSSVLVLAVQRIRLRSQRRKKRARVGGAFGIALLLAGFCGGVLVKESGEQRMEREQTYEALVDEADGLGFGQAAGRYEQAAQLRPGDAELYFHLLDRMLQDYRFDCEEEELMQRLLFAVLPGQQVTVWEQLLAQREVYGRLAYELGLAYWYFYEGSGGRTAAAKWFGRAVDSIAEDSGEAAADGEALVSDSGDLASDSEDLASDSEALASDREVLAVDGEDSVVDGGDSVVDGWDSAVDGEDSAVDEEDSAVDGEDLVVDREDLVAGSEEAAADREKLTEWEDSARIHAKISGYYEKLGRTDDSGTVQAGYWELWEDLCELWKSDSLQKEQVRVRWQVAKELVACVVMEAGELQERGEAEHAVCELLEEIRAFAGEQDLEEPYRGELEEQCEAAQAAVRRAYGAGGEEAIAVTEAAEIEEAGTEEGGRIEGTEA